MTETFIGFRFNGVLDEDASARHDGPTKLHSPEEVRAYISANVVEYPEIRIVDSGDLMVVHVVNMRMLFPVVQSWDAAFNALRPIGDPYTDFEQFSAKLQRSARSQMLSTLNLGVTVADLNEFFSHTTNRKIQDIFPGPSSVEREFLLSGYTEDEWKIMVPAAPTLIYYPQNKLVKLGDTVHIADIGILVVSQLPATASTVDDPITAVSPDGSIQLILPSAIGALWIGIGEDEVDIGED